jgi:uncharacterized protein YcbK (DUF882 family)
MQTLLGRRDALKFGAATLAGLATPAVGWASALNPDAPRRAVLHNLHTGDAFNEVYYANGAYVPSAMAEAMRVLRDWRNGAEHVMEPRLFDALHAISQRLETNQPFQIISGYRSPATNAMLHSRSSQVATTSQHTFGKAVDVRLPGVDLRNLHKAALDVSAGGVGFYPRSDFVHVDVGRVRRWTGA